MGPSTIYDKVFEEAGGMLDVEAISHAPRNIKQVKNARAKLKRASNDEDEFYSLLALGKVIGESCIKGLFCSWMFLRTYVIFFTVILVLYQGKIKFVATFL